MTEDLCHTAVWKIKWVNICKKTTLEQWSFSTYLHGIGVGMGTGAHFEALYTSTVLGLTHSNNLRYNVKEWVRREERNYGVEFPIALFQSKAEPLPCTERGGMGVNTVLQPQIIILSAPWCSRVKASLQWLYSTAPEMCICYIHLPSLGRTATCALQKRV